MQISCSFPGTGDLEMRAVGGFVYTKLLTDAANKWTEDRDEGEETSLSNFSPQRLLALLRAASSETQRTGEESVRGTSTVRYRFTVDCDKAKLVCEGRTDVDVWIDDEGLVRRIELDDDDVRGKIEFFDFGIEVKIERPPAGEIVKSDAVGSGGVSVGPVGTCSDREPAPIGRRLAVETLRRHGFTMLADGGCSLTNVAGSDGSDALEKEGIVFCQLSSERGDGPATVTRRGVDGADAELTLRNLTCTIFTDSPTGEEKIVKLLAAFEELRRAIRP